jgi:hypothetical protein
MNRCKRPAATPANKCATPKRLSPIDPELSRALADRFQSTFGQCDRSGT